MIAEEILAELRGAGALVEARGDVLHVEAAPGTLTPDRLRSLRELKPALLRLLAPSGVVGSLGGALQAPSKVVAGDGWPPESLDAEQRFGCWHARLYPFIGKTVSTPRGAGRLVQVFPDRASVILPGEAQVGVFLPDELWPLGRPRPVVPTLCHETH